MGCSLLSGCFSLFNMYKASSPCDTRKETLNQIVLLEKQIANHEKQSNKDTNKLIALYIKLACLYNDTCDASKAVDIWKNKIIRLKPADVYLRASFIIFLNKCDCIENRAEILLEIKKYKKLLPSKLLPSNKNICINEANRIGQLYSFDLKALEYRILKIKRKIMETKPSPPLRRK
ncbi:MAG: hypothetical protein FD145_332 [Candidatus Saganbacteria bacterium]|uniref:Uncharacterized protein n=1 Tax=Candidatus Saganbacteria bacterium TaxID=2575572 RepID=A0A833L239_UNCSA|nr:MAG: hypothetical protein FD145_332 [Candidatus Saganbacteria bacterium]